MLEQRTDNGRAVIRSRFGLFAICTTLLALSAGAFARDVTVTVISPTIDGTPITVGFRWVLQEDVTFETNPGMAVADELSTNLHKSHLPVVSTGDSGGNATTLVTIPDDAKRYYISVLPDQPEGIDCQGTTDCYTMSGRQILPGQDSAFVIVTPQPLPTAQIYILAHADIAPINNAYDAIEFEPGLGGFDVFIMDFTGGVLSTDNYGNPLGTEYVLDTDGLTPVVSTWGDGTIHTMTKEEVGDPLRNPHGLKVGEALVQNLAPGKYGVRVVPPQGEHWQQTSTIEGTPTIDAWVKAGEPRFYSEFGRRGPLGHHATFGFVRPEAFAPLAGTGTIIGQNMSLRFRRVPDSGFDLGPPTGVSPCYVALNDQTNISQGIYAGPCNDDDSFTIENVPAGTYLLMIFDRYLDNIYNSQVVTIGDGETVDMGEIGTFRWFGTLENWSFYDENEDGIWQHDVEPSMDEQAVNLRFRDGSIYQANATDMDGFIPYDEIFPFFDWLIAEVDFARFKHTGTTAVVDNGGTVSNLEYIGDGKRNPQIQNPDDGGTNCGMTNGTGQTGCLSRTETGPALLEGFLQFLGFNSRIDWGKKYWEEGENGGVSGIVYYATTRAENDPRFAAAEPWEPGVPNVQINLYRSDNAGNIDPTPGGLPNVVEYADIDNYPLGWSDGGAMGPEDQNNNTLGGEAAGCEASYTCVFSVGDAVEWVHTDSFDDNLPTDCPADSNTYGVAAPDPLHLPPDGEAATQFNGRCYDSQRNLNQIRPGVFDGGFGLGAPWTGMDDVDNVPLGWSTGGTKGPEDVDHNGDGIYDDVDYLPSGYYVMEAGTPPGYIVTATKDKNVDFGDTFTVNPLWLPAICVGEPDVIAPGDELNLFPGVPAPFQGETRRLCNRKLVQVTDGKNAAADFFLHTETPVAGQWKGFAINDLANEFDFQNPSFGEKWAPPHIPVSVRDYLGNEVYHSKTDRYGQYNVVVPSSYRINTPMASGVSAQMLQLCLNTPFMENPDFDRTLPAGTDNPKLIPDPFFNKQFSQFCWTFNAHSGLTTYLDTPLFAISAFSGPNNWQVDCEFPTLTPVIHSVSVENNGVGGGPYVPFEPTDAERVITIVSEGPTEVADPNGTRLEGVDTAFITRDFGFGDTEGTVTINGVELIDVTWFDEAITATIPEGVTTGQLVVTRGDNSVSTIVGLTVIIDEGPTPVARVPMDYPTIQEAVEMTPANGIVLVSPGEYSEDVIVTKPIQLQGWGANVTTILSAQSPSERLQEWRIKANYLVNCTGEIGLLKSEFELFEGPDPLPPGAEAWGESQFNNEPNVLAQCGHTPGTGLFATEEEPGIMIAPREGVFNGTTTARVDGFTVTGAINSHGIYVNGFANFQEISNNRVTGNQGKVGAGGIRVGIVRERPVHPASNHSDFVNIHHNDISENSSQVGPGGGVLVTRGTTNYRITNNYVCGNFTSGDGGGIAHYGLSNNGLIADNQVLLNHSFSQTLGDGTNGGGILVSGQGERVLYEPELPEVPTVGDPPLVAQFIATAGSGNVKILRNLIQGNNAGSGDGGGIALANLNGQDVIASDNQDTWHRVDILNNMIVNNVAGMTGGGISIKDGLKVSIVDNTIINNDSTATAYYAFSGCPGANAPTLSCPQPAGISAYAHSQSLIDTLGAVGTFSDPTMINNIVLGNRSQHWVVAFDSTLGFNVGTLVNDDLPSDFGVYPAGTGTLTASSSIFTTDSIADGHVIDAGGNIEVDGTIAAEEGIVVNPYRNGPPGFATVQPDGTVYAFAEFPADAKIAFDEGGNSIDVHYGPLSPVGDYHLQTADPNVALGAGVVPSAAMYPARSPDIDREGRPRCDSGATTPCGGYDIGADEVGAELDVSDDGNQAPMVLNPAPAGTVTAYISTPSGYQVIAHDPNGDSPLGYTLCAGPSGGACGALPAGISINNNGLISFAGPAPGDAGTYHLVVTDPFGATTEREFTLDVVSPFAPEANDDYFDVTVVGQWVLPYDNLSEGLSLLQANDIHPDEAIYGTVLRQLETGLTPVAAGFIVIDKQSLNPLSDEFPIISTFEYTPVPDFLGTASFTYRLTNNAGTDTATVTLARYLTMSDARFEPSAADPSVGTYHFAGLGFTPGEVLSIGLGPRDDIDFGPSGWATGDPKDPNDIDWNGNGIFDLGYKNPIPGGTTVVAGDGTWSLTVPGDAPAIIAAMPGDPPYVGPVLISLTGDTVTPPSTIVHQINDAPFLSVSRSGTHPLSTAYVQCPGDTDGDAIPENLDADGLDPDGRQIVCKHLGAGDGFARMADGKELYGFSFNDLTGTPMNLAVDKGILNAHFPAPTLDFDEGDEVYLTLTNVGMLIRPDLFDPHTVHFHGFPNASSTFDGVPEASIAINGGFSLTYYYNVVEPGTYMYHCHVEAAEHMQMGMLGNLYVRPAQNRTGYGADPTTVSTLGGNGGSSVTGYVYNDNDGSTAYDVEKAIQIGSFDGTFHDASHDVQPLPFAEMHDDYQLLNGRGYPDTVVAGPLDRIPGGEKDESGVTSHDESSQEVDTVITATAGQTILLRISNLNVTQFYTLATSGLTMQVIGTGAHILRGPGNTDADNLYYETNSVTLGGGEAVDVLIDTTGVTPGTYFLYSTNLNELSNGAEDFGGMMTEIVIN